MTRETKVGLIVAGSFLCLVGVVVASRLHRNSDAQPSESPLAQKIAPKDEPESVAKKDPEKAVKPAPDKKANASGVVAATFNPSQAPSQPAVNVPNPFEVPTAPTTGGVTALESIPALRKGEDPFAKSIKQEQVAKAELEQEKNVTELLERNVAQAAKKGAAPLHIPGRSLDDSPLIPPVTSSPMPAPPPPAAPPIGLGNDGSPIVGPTAAKTPELTPNPAPNADLFVGPIKEEGTQSPTTSAPPIPAPMTTVASQQEFKPLPAPPAEIKTKTAEPLIPAPAPIAFKEPTNPNLPAMGSEPKNYPLAPISASPVAPNPAGNLPQVRSIDLISHVCKPEDPTFEAVSNRYFGSPKYGRALLEYNRGMPTVQDNIRHDNPRLLPGQVVYVPPRDILEGKFAFLIDNRLISPVSAVSISPPLNSTLPGAASGASAIGRTPTPAFATKDITKPYRVAGDGQMLIEIAQQTLGDRGRWSEIYRLNPTLRPEYPVPGGTEIRLPSNATVPN